MATVPMTRAAKKRKRTPGGDDLHEAAVFHPSTTFRPSGVKRRRINQPQASKPASLKPTTATCQLPTPPSAAPSSSAPSPPRLPRSPWTWHSVVASPNPASHLKTSRYNPQFGNDVCRAYRTNQFNEHLRKHKYGTTFAVEWKKGSTPEEARARYAQKQEELRRLDGDDMDTSEDEGSSPITKTRGSMLRRATATDRLVESAKSQVEPRIARSMPLSAGRTLGGSNVKTL